MSSTWAGLCCGALLVMSLSTAQSALWRRSQKALCAPDHLPSNCTIGVYGAPACVFAMASIPSRVRRIAEFRGRFMEHVRTLHSTGMSCLVVYVHENSTDVVVVFDDSTQVPPGWDVSLVEAVNAQGCNMGYRLNSTTFRAV